MSSSTIFYTFNLEDLKSIIGSKREDVKEKLIEEYAVYSDPKNTIVKKEGETDKEFDDYVEKRQTEEKEAVERQKIKIEKVIDQGDIDESEYYPSYLLDFVEHELLDDNLSPQVFFDLIEKLVSNSEIDDYLTDMLSKVTEGRRITDGERNHNMGSADMVVGYWTLSEVPKLKSLLDGLDQSELGELSEVVKSLLDICQMAAEKEKDIFFTSS